MSILPLSAFLGLAVHCAPDVSAERLAAYAQVESGRNPVALNVNGPGGGLQSAADVIEAVVIAERFIAAGKSVDLGLMQVNSQWLPRFRVTVAQAMEPCRNIAMGAAILADADRQAACIYNTGKPHCRNGYDVRIADAVARVIGSARPLPETAPAATPSPEPEPIGPCGPPPASWDGWALAAHERCAARARTTLATKETRE